MKKAPRARYQPLFPTGTILQDDRGRLWRVTRHYGPYAVIAGYEPTGDGGPARESELQRMTVVANPAPRGGKCRTSFSKPQKSEK